MKERKKRTFRILSEKIVYQSKWMSISKLVTETDQEKMGTYDVVNRADCVSIIVENSDQKVLFVKSYRFPARIYEWELPMGGIEVHESSDMAAVRELKEETGIENTNLKKLGEFYPIPGLSAQRAHLYFGNISETNNDTKNTCSVDVDEIVERKYFDWTEIVKMIKHGEISDALTLGSLMYWKSLGGTIWK